MKTMKRILTLLLALTLVLGIAVPVFAADIVDSGTCGENLTWTLDSQGTLTITGTGKMNDYWYNAPWRDYKTAIKKVIIGNGVTSIGYSAFDGCSSLTSITIPEGVTSIGSNAFYGCSSLTGITIPKSVTSISWGAFYYCSSLTSVTIPGSVISFDSSAFEGCSSLTSITIPDSVTSIGSYAFRYCSSLTSITIPEGVTSIGAGAFWDCSSLTSIKIPGSVTSIGDWTFSGCSSLTGIWVDQNNECYSSDDCGVLFNKDKTELIQAPGAISGAYAIPGSVNSIEWYAFEGCSSLTSITIPESVTSIGQAAFYECSSLTSITIPASVTYVAWVSFGYCEALKKITFIGDFPEIKDNAFSNVTATVYYPTDNATWTKDVRQNYDGKLTWVAYSKTAKPSKIVNVVSGVHVYWNKIPGVTKYGLWRSETGKNGTYKWIANPTVPHFTDTKVESGKTYYYKVTTMDGSGKHSAKSSAIGLTYVSTPDISARYNKAAGVKLDWKKVTGATGYAIYRKSYSGNDAWVRVATISGNATFTWTDTSVKNNNGTAYKYTIRALAGSNMKTLSGCRNAGRSMVRLTSRTLSSAAKASATSIKCSWDASSAVTGYEVRFMVGSTVYKTFTVGDCKVGTKTFTGLKAGQTYKIQIRSYKKIDGMGFYSAWSTAKEVKL